MITTEMLPTLENGIVNRRFLYEGFTINIEPTPKLDITEQIIEKSNEEKESSMNLKPLNNSKDTNKNE